MFNDSCGDSRQNDLGQRREMMQWRADFLDGSKVRGKLLPISGKIMGRTSRL